MFPSSVGKWKMRPYPVGSVGNRQLLFLDVQMLYTAPVFQNISRIYHDMASSQSSRLYPEGPKKLQPTRDSSVKFKICTSHHSTFGMYVLLLLQVFSPWGGLGRDQSSVSRLVQLWYAASWASSYGQFAIAFPRVQTFPLSPLGASTTREILAAEGGTVGENVFR